MRVKMARAHKYYSDLTKIKMVEALKYYVFEQRRAKKMVRYRSLLIWSKKIKTKTLIALKANG